MPNDRDYVDPEHHCAAVAWGVSTRYCSCPDCSAVHSIDHRSEAAETAELERWDGAGMTL